MGLFDNLGALGGAVLGGVATMQGYDAEGAAQKKNDAIVAANRQRQADLLAQTNAQNADLAAQTLAQNASRTAANQAQFNQDALLTLLSASGLTSSVAVGNPMTPAKLPTNATGPSGVLTTPNTGSRRLLGN